MLPKLSLLVILCLSSVFSQTQTKLECAKTNPLVGLTVDILEFETLRKSGTAVVLDDCSIQLDNFTLRSLLTVELVRQNQRTNALEDIFVGGIVSIGNPFSQIFVLKNGLTLVNGDVLVFIDSRTTAIGSINFVLPRTTTTTTTTTTRATTTTTVRLSASASPSPVSNAVSDPGKVYNPSKLVLVTLNSNVNYPNPPTTQSVSFYINNVESAVLTLVRGNDYTFSIMGGAQHPFYLTSSIEGGKKLFPDSDEKIFLGNSTTWGTLQSPLLLPFKAADDLPNEFYYQCWNHTRMGWKVLLIKPNELQSNNIPPLVSGSERKYTGLLISMFIIVLSAVVGF